MGVGLNKAKDFATGDSLLSLPMWLSLGVQCKAFIFIFS